MCLAGADITHGVASASLVLCALLSDTPAEEILANAVETSRGCTYTVSRALLLPKILAKGSRPLIHVAIILALSKVVCGSAISLRRRKSSGKCHHLTVRGSWDKIDACVDGVHDHKVDHADEPKV